MLLLLLATAITLNLLRAVRAAGAGRRARGRPAASAPARSPPSSRRPAPGRSSARRWARRCCCRRRARCWSSPRSGSASRSRSCASPSSPRCASGCPSPGRGWRGCSASSPSRWRRPRSRCLWLLWRQGGTGGAARRACVAAALVVGLVLSLGSAGGSAAADRSRSALVLAVVAGQPAPAICRSPQRRDASAAQRRRRARGARRGSPTHLRAGPPGVRLFHRRLVPDLQGQ